MRVLVVVLALLASCYDVPTPACGFSCLQEGECPDGYTCNNVDGFCHLNGALVTCPGHEGISVDRDPPFIISVTPDPSSTLEMFASIEVQFNERVTNVTSSSFFVTVDSTGERLDSNVDAASGQLEWFLAPLVKVGFPDEQQLTVTLTNDIHDLSNNPLQEQTLHFFTARPPQLTGSSPGSGQLGVSVGTVLSLFFDENVINIATKFHLQDASGTPVQIAIDPSSDTMNPFFNLRFQLAPQTQYRGIIDAGLRGTGPATTTAISFVFTTGLDNLGPRIWSRLPGFNSFGVDVGSIIEVDFDEAAQNVNTGSLVLQKNGVNVPATVTYDAINKLAVLRPNNQLDPQANYDVVVATTITDVFGNACLDGGWSFQTDLDRVAPRIRSTIPASASSGANVATTIVMTFDEPTAIPNLVVTAEPSTNISGTVVASNGNRTFTFTPDAPLPPSTIIDVNVGLVQDLAGNATTYFYKFTTAP